MLLLKPAVAQITAAANGSQIGWGDGTSGGSFPGVAFGSISYLPPYFAQAGRTLHYILVDSSNLEIYLDGSLGDLITATITLGGNTYTNSDYFNNTSFTGGHVYRWTRLAALTAGQKYQFKVV